MNINIVRELMDKHDWYYEYSDDHGEFLKGIREQVIIIRAMRKLPINQVNELFNKVPEDLRYSWFEAFQNLKLNDDLKS